MMSPKSILMQKKIGPYKKLSQYTAEHKQLKQHDA